MEFTVHYGDLNIRLCVIYRPPPSKSNGLRNTVFFEEWESYLDQNTILVPTHNVLFTGDFNFHLDNLSDPDALRFHQSLEDRNLTQHVKHERGHILDLLITNKDSQILNGVPNVQRPNISDAQGNLVCDHFSVHATLACQKPKRYKIQIVGSLEGVQCASDRYQPFIFWTNGSYLCKFEKSLCHGEGEVRYSLGTTTEDRACRCDYTNGYDFVVSPNHTCFCMPTEEDCSCFMRQCPSGFVLSPDYDCAPVHKLLEKSRCPLMSTVSRYKMYQRYENLDRFFDQFCADSCVRGNIVVHERKSCHLITGPFGSGKTAIAYYIISKLEKEGYEIIVAAKPEDIVRRFRINQSQLFLFDDILGKYSSNISDITDGWEKTPLYYASKHRMCNIAKTLILNKALVNTSDDQGSTPLHMSCKCGNEDVVKLLVKHNAVTSSKNKEGLTPLDIAMLNGFDTISSFYVSVGQINNWHNLFLFLCCTQIDVCTIKQE
ncbi:unnamed protein product [Mytilus edulis]|uniref:Novel STAND NTPase 3 domain-containing protein n=1 Tax=Mytilus edulis TaxID=6550 RepID=A0A8S3PVL9_MYTED|nr:unnamed protein product [Mytilus edulis]